MVGDESLMFNTAKKIASKSEHKQHHHACIITCGGAIIATGYNRKYLHAEMDALSKIKPSQSRKRLTLWSFRARKDGTWGCSRPCSKCRPWLVGIKVYYIDWGGRIQRLR